MATTQASWLDAVPGARASVEYIESKVGEFLQLGQRLSQSQARAARLRTLAAQQGQTAAAAKAFTASQALESLRSTYTSTKEKLSSVLDQLKAAGFGFIPLALIGAALAVAAGMAYLFKAVSFQERLLDDVEKGLLTPGQAGAISAGGSPFGGLAQVTGNLSTLALVAGGGFLLYQFAGGGRRRRA